MTDLDLSPEAAALLAAEKSWPGPSTAAQERVLARVCATVGIGVGLGSGGGGASPAPGSPPPAPAPGPGSGGTGAATASSGNVLPAMGTRAGAALLKPGLMIAFVVGAAAGTGGTLLVQRLSSSPAELAPRSTAVPTRSVASVPESAPLPTTAGPAAAASPAAPKVAAGRRERHARVRRPATNKNGAESLAAERRLVELARAALARGRPADALEALARHRQRFPAGQLAEERDGLSVLGRVATGELRRARQDAGAFRRRYPRSLLLPAIEAAIAGQDPPGE